MPVQERVPLYLSSCSYGTTKQGPGSSTGLLYLPHELMLYCRAGEN
jgi:hypothetical protein